MPIQKPHAARARPLVVIVTVLLVIGLATSVAATEDFGLVNSNTAEWRLRDSGGAVISFTFGNPGDLAIMGDWNCDGIATPGMYRQSGGFVYLRNSNSSGAADILFFFGDPGDVPIVGDFNGNGCDTVSIYRPGTQTFHIINKLGRSNSGLGAADVSYAFGDPGDKPFVGDFDGDGIDTVGLHRESTGLVYFRQSHSRGVADASFMFGDPGDRFVAGDWNGNSIDSPSLFRPSTGQMFFRFTNTQGVADSVLYLGTGSESPVAGDFGDLIDSFPNDAGCSAALFTLTNSARADKGLAPLAFDSGLAAVAHGHSRAMVLEGFFDHVSPVTGNFMDRLAAAGIFPTAGGENIAFDPVSCGTLHDLWMASPTHRANILNPAYTKGGFGVVASNGFMGTQLFSN